MAWSTPRTWTSGETVTAAIMNAHIRDQLNILSTHIDNNGEHENALLGIGFGSGQGNVSSSETDLDSYNFTIPANFLADGESIQLVGLAVAASNGNTKTLKFYPDSTNSGTIYSAADNNKVIRFDMLITRRSSTTAAMTGIVSVYASGGGALSSNLGVNVAIGSLDWTVSQTAKLTGQGTATDDIKMTDFSVRHWRGHGAIV